MSKEKVLKVTPASIALDAILVGVVWLLFTLWFMPHVMVSYDAGPVFFWAAFSALPAAGTFFLCLQMFKVTLAHQRKLKAEKEKKD